MPTKKSLAPWEEAAQTENKAPWETVSKPTTKPQEQFTASNLVEALLPRTIQTNKAGKNESTFRNLANTLLDLGSLPLLFISQFASGLFFDKGMTFLNAFSIFKPYFLEPLPGVFYFFGLQGISKALLIMLDMEDNSRRAARK